MLNTLLYWSENPFIIATAIIFLSYLLEDAAIVGAALLSVDGALPISIAIAAVFIGIATGDVALFYLGRWSHKIRWVQTRLAHPKVQFIQTKLRKNAFLNVFLIRFLPGLRGTGYLVCGVLDIKPLTFFLAVGSATLLWSILIFSSIFALGDAFWLTDSIWRWLLAPLLILLILVINRTINNTLFKDNLA